MGSFGGDLTDYGQTGSMVLKNIQATYKAPKTQLEQQTQETDISSLTFAEILALVPTNWHDEESDYWSENESEPFNCRDGQTNSYVKRGTGRLYIWENSALCANL